jgi:hypothetical protein
MTSAAEPADSGDLPSEELVGLVIRASRLGFSPSRVATALDISARGYAVIRARLESHEIQRPASSPTTRRINAR